jgi:hypothetical protein
MDRGIPTEDSLAKMRSIGASYLVGTPKGRLPTTDGRELTLSRYTQPEPEHRMLLDQLRLSLPSQPPPKISAAQAKQTTAELTL